VHRLQTPSVLANGSDAAAQAIMCGAATRTDAGLLPVLSLSCA
jgi:hypothetical protein